MNRNRLLAALIIFYPASLFLKSGMKKQTGLFLNSLKKKDSYGYIRKQKFSGYTGSFEGTDGYSCRK